MRLHVFGLSGGIGSGKSTVAAHFRARGLPVVDADVLAREVVSKGSEGLTEIIAAFGAGILTSTGELDRSALAHRVFGDPAQRALLESMTHPRVRALARERLSEIEARGEPLACYEVPLLFEAGLTDTYRPTVVVTCSPEQQIERAMRRDGATRERILARISAQMPLSEKARRADYVIDNSGDLATTKANADRVLALVCADCDVDSARYLRES
ncbi:MAG TPA: dephospho-CoA kinase [Polyangiaceae bacterium]|nr:dephospho-CoA kinase [Polyangiaceae bacterium]